MYMFLTTVSSFPLQLSAGAWPDRLCTGDGLPGPDVAPETPHLTNLPLYSLFCFLTYLNSEFSVHIFLGPLAHLA